MSADDIDEINDEWREVIRYAKRRGIAAADVKQRLATMMVRRPEAEARDGGAPKPPIALEEEDDLMRDVAKLQRQAMRMKLQMDLLRSMGILKEEDKGDIADVLKVLALASAGGRGEDKEMDVKEMLTYVIMMKALGGEKSSDWKDFMAVLMPLIQQGKGKEIDPFQIIEKMKEIERSAKEEESEKWKAFMEMMSKGSGGEEDFLGQEARRLMRERIIDALRESLYPSKKIVTEGGKVDWGAIADKILSTIQDAVKRMPVQSPPPPPSGSFEAMSVEQPPAEQEAAPAEQPAAEAPAEGAPAEQPAESPPPPSPSEGVKAGGEG